ncbi:hypothetical protein BC830DRAFT_1087461 [Chytriomyces sp. MP71]|nr:hypothetical protein BC830DRAFT_1087461 [Chytriomyces sp. MP71]
MAEALSSGLGEMNVDADGFEEEDEDEIPLESRRGSRGRGTNTQSSAAGSFADSSTTASNTLGNDDVDMDAGNDAELSRERYDLFVSKMRPLYAQYRNNYTDTVAMVDLLTAINVLLPMSKHFSFDELSIMKYFFFCQGRDVRCYNEAYGDHALVDFIKEKW